MRLKKIYRLPTYGEKRERETGCSREEEYKSGRKERVGDRAKGSGR